MKIILMRHGKPVLTHTGRIAPAEMKRWIEHYNCAAVENETIPATCLELVNSSAHIVASTSSRAISSVQALGCSPSVIDEIFCEASLPSAAWAFPRLSPFVWATFFRILWLAGYSQGAESLKHAQSRANVAALKLVSLAEEGPVLLMGHGIMNHLIGKELVARGWSGPKKQESQYWGASVYQL